MYLDTWSHRVKASEVRAEYRPDGSVVRYVLDIRDPRISVGKPIEIYVKGNVGFEPATNFHHLGNGTVFRAIEFGEGSVRIEFADHANQTVHSPIGMKLRFYHRPSMSELTHDPTSASISASTGARAAPGAVRVR